MAKMLVCFTETFGQVPEMSPPPGAGVAGRPPPRPRAPVLDAFEYRLPLDQFRVICWDVEYSDLYLETVWRYSVRGRRGVGRLLGRGQRGARGLLGMLR